MTRQEEGFHLECKVLECGERKLIGIEIVCPFQEMETEIPKAWLAMKNRIRELNGLVNDGILYGMYPQESDNPDPGQCYYYICAEVHAEQPVPEGMVRIDIPPQKYVSCVYRGPIKQFYTAYAKVNAFIASEGYVHNRKAYVLELKGPRTNVLDKETPENELELRIPIE